MELNGARKGLWGSITLFIFILIIGIIFVVFPAIGNWGSSFYPARSLTVSAQGKTTAPPDLAEVSFSVVTQGQDPKTLSQNNNDKMTAVIGFVKAQGVADADVKTTGYDLSPNYTWNKNTLKNVITGYTLTQTVQVKVHDLSKVATIIGGLAPQGVNQIQGVNFTFADQEKVLAAARADGFNKALAKAEEMANEAGVSLGKIVNVSESNYLPIAYGMGGGSAVMGAGDKSVSVPSIQPGTQDITDNVSITYEIH